MSKKYYAVKEGKETGIFTSWDECQKHVIGHKGSIYKSFTTLLEANNYLYDIPSDDNQSEIFVPNDEIDYIFCDGSEIKGTNKAGYGVYYPKYNIKKSFDMSGGTNNQAEIKAVIESFKYINENNKQNHLNKKYIIVSDSRYVINSILEWIPKWKNNFWKKSDGKIIENLELIKKLESEYKNILNNGINIEFLHYNSHQKKPLKKTSLDYYLWFGNYTADLLAKNTT